MKVPGKFALSQPRGGGGGGGDRERDAMHWFLSPTQIDDSCGGAWMDACDGLMLPPVNYRQQVVLLSSRIDCMYDRDTPHHTRLAYMCMHSCPTYG